MAQTGRQGRDAAGKISNEVVCICPVQTVLVRHDAKRFDRLDDNDALLLLTPRGINECLLL